MQSSRVDGLSAARKATGNRRLLLFFFDFCELLGQAFDLISLFEYFHREFLVLSHGSLQLLPCFVQLLLDPSRVYPVVGEFFRPFLILFQKMTNNLLQLLHPKVLLIKLLILCLLLKP